MPDISLVLIKRDTTTGLLRPGRYLYDTNGDIEKSRREIAERHKDDPNFVAVATITWDTAEYHIEVLRQEMEKQKALIVAWQREQTERGELAETYRAPTWDAYRDALHAYRSAAGL